MSWDYKISERALKQLKKLDKQAAAQIIAYLDERMKTHANQANSSRAS